MPFEVIRRSRAFREAPGFIRRGAPENEADRFRESGQVVAGPFDTEAEADAAALQLAEVQRVGNCRSKFLYFVRQVFTRSGWATVETDGYGCPE